jgi:hypothetical protein
MYAAEKCAEVCKNGASMPQTTHAGTKDVMNFDRRLLTLTCVEENGPFRRLGLGTDGGGACLCAISPALAVQHAPALLLPNYDQGLSFGRGNVRWSGRVFRRSGDTRMKFCRISNEETETRAMVHGRNQRSTSAKTQPETGDSFAIWDGSLQGGGPSACS